VASGQLSWSAAELLARVAQPESEALWLERAQRLTVRQLRAELKASDAAGAEHRLTGSLRLALDREESWLLEATLALLDGLGTHGMEDRVEALLAEAQSALLAALPASAMDPDELEAANAAQQRWRVQLACWREESEARCEPRIRALAHPMPAGNVAAQGSSAIESWKSCELDAEVRRLAAEMASRELRLSRLLLRFQRADGWRRLGFATETQYARERLGLSRSSLLARRALALRLEKLPRLAHALGRAAIGIEAALQLVRIATPATELEWLERARGRTVKHLREEVAAALVAVRISGDVDCPPPRSEELDGFQELERAVLRGAVVEGAVKALPASRRPWHEMLTSLGAWLASGASTTPIQTSAHPSSWARSAGRALVRWRVSLSLCEWWRTLEQRARPWLPRGMSWVRFLCLTFWRAWQHAVGVNAAYGRVYVRDRCRCSSPVCHRRDVTPHHLVFRSAGGSDDDENVASLCTWCHLFGIHGGRIRATGTASHIFWEIGPYLRVDGRERWVK
jgi:hypothetical protein